MQETITVKKKRKEKTAEHETVELQTVQTLRRSKGRTRILTSDQPNSLKQSDQRQISLREQKAWIKNSVHVTESIVVRGLEKDPLSADDKVLVDLKRETDLDEAFLGQMLNTGWGEWSQSCFGLCVS